LPRFASGITRALQQIASAYPLGSITGPTPGLVALFLFNEGSGQTAFDSSGNGYHLQLGALAGADSADPAWIQAEAAIDDVPPTIEAPVNLRVIDPKGTTPGEVVSYSATVVDNCDLSPTLLCVPSSGSFFPRGTTIVTCTATDRSGNTTVHTFPVVVLPTIR
jgi:hypothetical protein